MNHRLHSRSKQLALCLAAAGFAGTVGAVPTSTATFTTPTTPAVRINEVLASNTRIANGATFPDLIELHNAGSSAADLSGKSLTDDPALPRKYVFPAGTNIPAGGYLVVYADTATTAPGLHTGFALDAEGDQVRLHDNPANGGVLLDAIVFGFQIPNYSLSRTGAAANVWALTTPTTGAANAAPVPLGSPAAITINEWAGKITFRLDHDLIELFNPAAQPVAIGGVRLTDDVTQLNRFTFPALSFVDAAGFVPLYGADFVFGLDGDRETITLSGENNERIDQVAVLSQARDVSGGRSPDGSATLVTLPIPTPGISNQTPLPAAYTALLNNLRITEIMYQPAAANNSSSHEFIELQNIGTAALDLSGVRFTNGLDYTFPAGTTLAAGAFIVVVNDRSTFLSRYPGAAGVMAPGGYNGGLDNTGETLALTLPSPWNVHILRFRFEPEWYPSASGGGNSIVVTAPATTGAQDWKEKSTWRASAAVNGSPGAAEAGSPPTGASTARLTNLSILTSIATAGDNFTMGYVVGGAGTSGTKPILIRAAGPTLGAAPFNIGGSLGDPKLETYAGSTKTGENDNWGGTTTLSNAFAAVGAFAYFSPASLDAAVLASIAAGDNSVRVSASGNGTGTVIAELYDSTASTAMTATTPRLVNVSVLKALGTGLTVGFVIDGAGAKKVLIRAVGPTIGAAPFNVAGAVADPQLQLFSGQTVIGGNDNWGGTAELTAAFTQVGAFALPATSRDAAIVATLQPGSYTVQVSGVAGTTGVAIVEVYDVP
ncbi:lamin tail domain-containing protein [Horticoccus sp. 23ND18S-11]|uniref:lamin tail domain-containing protein n=1 Tax=Horticoccus sp. 23ND18S-11 TaxID=3391832 RepID=UPI0039C91ADE